MSSPASDAAAGRHPAAVRAGEEPASAGVPDEGPLTRFTTAVYRHLALGVSLALACLPTVIVQTLFRPEASSVAVFVAALLPVAPALAAGLYTVRGWRRTPDAGPFALFVRGYRLNLWDVTKWWAPLVLIGVVLSIDIVFAEAVPGAGVLRGIGIVLAVALTLWSGHALVISAFFSFRTRDVLRVAVVELFSRWQVTLAFASLLIVAITVVYLATEVGLLALAWAFVAMCELVSRPVVQDVTARFTGEG